MPKAGAAFEGDLKLHRQNASTAQFKAALYFYQLQILHLDIYRLFIYVFSTPKTKSTKPVGIVWIKRRHLYSFLPGLTLMQRASYLISTTGQTVPRTFNQHLIAARPAHDLNDRTGRHSPSSHLVNPVQAWPVTHQHDRNSKQCPSRPMPIN